MIGLAFEAHWLTVFGFGIIGLFFLVIGILTPRETYFDMWKLSCTIESPHVVPIEAGSNVMSVEVRHICILVVCVSWIASVLILLRAVREEKKISQGYHRDVVYLRTPKIIVKDNTHTHTTRTTSAPNPALMAQHLEEEPE